jgi:transcriptional regulator with XRE-family HTH domain
MSSFGQTVRARRKEKRYGLIEFAERIGLSPPYWSRIERGHEKPPRDDIIERVAGILNLPLDELFIQANRLPTDMRDNLRRVVALYRREPF